MTSLAPTSQCVKMAASEGTATDLSLQLPMCLLRKSTGFALDMGGSVLKMAYLDKADWEGADMDGRPDDDLGTVHFHSFPADQLSEAFTFMKEHFYVRPIEGASVVYVSGVGLQKHGPKIQELLGVRMEIMIETDCFVRALLYCIQHVPESTTAAPSPVTGLQRGVDRSQKILQHQQDTQRAGVEPTLDIMDDLTEHLQQALTAAPRDEPLGDSVQFPVLIAMMGSVSTLMKVSEDGTYSMTAVTPIGGRTLVALGSLLTGAKDYDELMSLAAMGDQRSLNVHLQDMITADGRTDNYSKAGALDLFIYAMGKAVGKSLDDFSREDLARSVLHLVAYNSVNIATMQMAADGVRHLFIAGSFANDPTTRDILAEEFHQLQTKSSVFERKWHSGKLHMMKIGGHLGALGALLHGCGQW